MVSSADPNPNAEMNEATAIHFLFLASLIRRRLGQASYTCSQPG